MSALRAAALLLAAGVAAPAALAEDHAAYEYLATLPGALQPCRAGMAVNLPASWRAGDGAVVLLTTQRSDDVLRDRLVAALLSEQHAAVLEPVPLRCDGAPAAQDELVAGAFDALDVLVRTAGAGLVVAIGYGPGARAVLPMVSAPADGLRGVQEPRFAAAVALGDGPSAFALAARPLGGGDAAPRLAALCRALTVVLGDTRATPDRAAAEASAAACVAAMAGDAAPAGPPATASSGAGPAERVWPARPTTPGAPRDSR